MHKHGHRQTNYNTNIIMLAEQQLTQHTHNVYEVIPDIIDKQP